MDTTTESQLWGEQFRQNVERPADGAGRDRLADFRSAAPQAHVRAEEEAAQAIDGESGGLSGVPARTPSLEQLDAGRVPARARTVPAGDRSGSALRAGLRRAGGHLRRDGLLRLHRSPPGVRPGEGRGRAGAGARRRSGRRARHAGARADVRGVELAGGGARAAAGDRAQPQACGGTRGQRAVPDHLRPLRRIAEGSADRPRSRSAFGVHEHRRRLVASLRRPLPRRDTRSAADPGSGSGPRRSGQRPDRGVRDARPLRGRRHADDASSGAGGCVSTARRCSRRFARAGRTNTGAPGSA